MVEIKLLKESVVRELFDAVPVNLSTYRSGSFNSLLSDTSLFINSSCMFDAKAATRIVCSDEDNNEVVACLAILDTLSGVSAYLARDERLWTRLSHIEFLDYSRMRWPIPVEDEKAVAHIRKHFFAKGSRGVERDNSISRLWWMATLCARVENLSLEESLQAFLYQSDVRANIIERPTTSQNASVLSAVINKLHESLLDDKSLYEREKFRSLMKKLNIEGGVKLLEALEYDGIKQVVQKAAT